MIIDETPAERAYARQERTPSAWTEALSATGRRAAVQVAVNKLTDWVANVHEERPTRGEIRAWLELVLGEWRGLKERSKVAVAQREEAWQSIRKMHAELDAVVAQRDDALADASELRDRVWFLDEDRTRRTRERDDALEALEKTIAERNELARHNRTLRETITCLRRPRFGRASCKHPRVGGGAE
jgi:chromosome segregation ATPase